MNCNMCREGIMNHQYVLYSEKDNNIIIPSTDEQIKKVEESTSQGLASHEGRRVVHIYNCSDCPNSQLEFYLPEDAVAYEMAMNRRNVLDPEFGIVINKLVRSKMKEIMRLDIDPSVLTPEIAERIVSILDLEGNTKEELQNKRDSFVVLSRDIMAERISKIKNARDIFESTKYVTAVTTVIDTHLVNLGEEQ